MKISILGVGAFGIALAKVFYKCGNEISMWSKFQNEVDLVNLKRENENVLPGIKIPDNIFISTDMKSCVENSNIIVIATPMSAVREVSSQLSKCIADGQVICIASKGIENGTNKLMGEVVYEETKSDNICMLSGPSFAIELANGAETAMVVASKSEYAKEQIINATLNSDLIISTSSDIQGVEICSAIKNVFAILLGIVDGKNKSESTRASILTLIISDMIKICKILDGEYQTALSYAGVGDLLLTCMSDKSRNYTLGKYIGTGMSLKQALEEMTVTTVEGLYTLDALKEILNNKDQNINSIDAIFNIVYNNVNIDNILQYIVGKEA